MKRAFILFFFIFLFFWQTPVYAKEETIVCDTKSCTPTGIPEFITTEFSKTTGFFWFPGKEVNHSLKIINSSPFQQYILLSPVKMIDLNSVSQVMHITITHGDEELYSNSLYTFINRGELFIYKIDADKTEGLNFNIKMYETAGNEYKGISTKNEIVFDLDFALEIGLLNPEDYISPTPIPCTAIAPPPIQQLTLGKIGVNQILVEWDKSEDEETSTKKENLTGYSIAYATNEQFSSYTQKYIGISNQFIIKNVDFKQNRYYVKVISINDCTEGKWSSVISIGLEPTLLPTQAILIASNPTVTSNPIISLTPIQIESASEQNDILPTLAQIEITQPSTVGQVKGIATNKKCDVIWWQILCIETISLILLFFGKHRFIKTKLSFSVLLSLLYYVIFLIVNTCLFKKYYFIVISDIWYVSYFWILDLLILCNIFILNKASVKLFKSNSSYFSNNENK